MDNNQDRTVLADQESNYYNPQNQANVQLSEQQQNQTYNQQAYYNQTYGQQPGSDMSSGQNYGQQQMYNPAYGQQTGYNPAYGQQVGYNTPLGQNYGQQNYGQQQMYNPAYGQQNSYNPGYGQMYTGQKNKVNVVESIKDVKNDFTGKVKKMGISLYCLLGIIGAMLLIMVPFMNFASVHVNQNVTEDHVGMKVKVADGLTLFELSKLSNTADRGVDLYATYAMGNSYGFYSGKAGISKGTLADMLDAAEGEAMSELEDELDQNVSKSSVREVFGIMHLLLKGQGALAVTPWLIILSGLGLLIFSVVNRKIPKFICAGISLCSLIWLMICSSHFFSIIGIGAVALIVGIILAVISAILDKTAYQ